MFRVQELVRCCVAATVAFWVSGAKGQNPVPPSPLNQFTPSDNVHVGGWGFGQAARSVCSMEPLDVEIPISRYYGDPIRLSNNKLLPRYAQLSVAIYASCPIQLTVNNRALVDRVSEPGSWMVRTLDIPIGDVKFPAVPGETAINTIRVQRHPRGNTTFCFNVGPASLTVEAPPPVVLIHGFLADGYTAWGNSAVKDAITTLGIPTSGAQLDLGRFGSYQSRAAELSRFLKDFRLRYGVRDLVLLGHSRGGLDARRYVSDNASDHGIAEIIQLGSPNLGAMMLGLTPYAHSLDELSLLGAVRFNSRVGLTSPVPMVSIAGVQRISRGVNVNDWRCGYVHLGPSDGIVVRNSAWGVTNARKLEYVSYSDEESDVSACHSALRFQPGASELVSAVLLERAQAGAKASISTKSVGRSKSTSPGVQYGLPLSLSRVTWRAGQPDPIIDLPGGRSVVISVAHDAETTPTVRLRRPDGTVYEGAIEDLSGVAGIPAVLLSIPAGDAVEGTWTASVQGASAAGISVQLAEPTVYASATISDPVTPLDEATYKVSLVDATGAPVRDASVGVALGASEFRGVAVGDGDYEVRVMAPSIEGQYPFNFEVRALGETFYSAGELLVSQSADAFQGSASHSTRDVNGDGLFDELNFSVPVNLFTAGAYRILGRVTAPSGASFDVVSEFESNGTREAVVLTLPGKSVAESGTYRLEDLRLVAMSGESSEEAGVVASRPGLAAETSTLDRVSFDRPALVVKASEATWRFVDASGGPGIDSLIVSVPVLSTRTATLRGSATLMDSNDAQLGLWRAGSLTDSGQIKLVPGSNLITMAFPVSASMASRTPTWKIDHFVLYGERGDPTTMSPIVIAEVVPPALADLEGYMPCEFEASTTPHSDGFTLSFTNRAPWSCYIPKSGFRFYQDDGVFDVEGVSDSAKVTAIPSGGSASLRATIATDWPGAYTLVAGVMDVGEELSPRATGIFEVGPPVPTGFTAEPTNDGAILTWNTGPFPRTTHTLRYREGYEGEYTTVQGDIEGLRYALTGLKHGTLYEVLLTAKMNGVESKGSAQWSFITTRPPTLQLTPTQTSSHHVLLSWTPARKPSNYQLRGGTDPAALSSIYYGTATSVTYAPIYGNTYYFQVKTNEGIPEYSEVISYRHDWLPAVPPDSITLVPGDRKLEATWAGDRDAHSFNVYVSSDPGNPGVARPAEDGRRAVLDGLENGVKYFVWVQGVNPAGAGALSAPASGTPFSPVVDPPVTPPTGQRKKSGGSSGLPMLVAFATFAALRRRRYAI